MQRIYNNADTICTIAALITVLIIPFAALILISHFSK